MEGKRKEREYESIKKENEEENEGNDGQAPKGKSENKRKSH
jgi:hypothetical protein